LNQSLPKQKARALLACYGGGHVNMIIPIYQELKFRGFDVVLLGLTAAQKRLTSLGIEHVVFSDFITSKDKYAKSIGYGLIKGMHLNDTIDVEESVAYMGVSYCELQEKLGKRAAAKEYQKKGRQCFLPINYATRILNQLTPA